MTRLSSVIFFLFWLTTVNLPAQTTTFLSLLSGNWSASGNWSNGTPDSNTDVIIAGSLTFNCTVNINGTCNNLKHINLSTIKINSGKTLTVSGELTLGLLAAFTNNGTLIMKGNLIKSPATTILTIQGGVTSASGLTFPGNISID